MFHSEQLMRPTRAILDALDLARIEGRARERGAVGQAIEPVSEKDFQLAVEAMLATGLPRYCVTEANLFASTELGSSAFALARSTKVRFWLAAIPIHGKS